jgi:hypothetical protein
MSTLRLALALLFITLAGASCFSALAQNCTLSGTPAWNSALRNIVGDCSDDIISPSKRYTLHVSAEGAMSLSTKVEQTKFRWNDAKLVPPAMLSWSPNSGAFFLNDGDGSGMASSFRFFRINGTEVDEDDLIEKAAVSLYRRRTHCSASSADPNVWGFGWGKNGGEIFLLVQPTVNESCGRPDDFISLIVRTSDGGIVGSLSKTQTEQRFRSQLPSSLFGH